MGRPKEHDAKTAAALLDAAELLVSAHGARGLSMRAVADQVGTTTRAIYSLFGSKDGLITALGVRAFDLLATAVDTLPVTEDPAADLVEAGVTGFRGLFIEHPALFTVGIQQHDITPAQLVQIRVAANRAWVTLQRRVERLQQAHRPAHLDVQQAARAFHALCEGLAALELRGFASGDTAERQWRIALTALVNGFASI